MTTVGQLYRTEFNNRIKDAIESNESIFLLSFSELSGLAISDLRKELQKAGASMFVSKNSVAAKALEEMDHAPMVKMLERQTAFIWSNEDSAAISKILVEFSKEKENVNVQGGLLDGRILQDSDVKVLSDLPSREVLLSTLLGTIQAPLTRLAGALNAKSRDLLSILKQYSEKKGGN